MTTKRTSPAHTPGPWTCDEVETRVYDAPGRRAQPVAFVDIRPGEGERQANLRLIAAAPDLLMAVKDARGYVQFLMTDDSFGKDDPEAMIRLFDKVIAKAEGR